MDFVLFHDVLVKAQLLCSHDYLCSPQLKPWHGHLKDPGSPMLAEGKVQTAPEQRADFFFFFGQVVCLVVHELH